MHDEDSASKVSKGKADENASIAAPESVMEKEEEKDHVPKKRPEWKIKTEKFLDNYIVIIFMMVVTVYALFFDDVRILALPPSTDATFDVVTFLCIILYLAELILSSLAIEDYFLSFFFWLDLLAALSMFPDVSFIVNALSEGGTTTNYSDLAKTSRASKVTRVIRIIRLIRLIRIVKLYKQQKLFQATRAKKIMDARLASRIVRKRGSTTFTESSIGGNKVAPGGDLNDSVDSFEDACMRFDQDYGKEKGVNADKFKGLILEVPEAYIEETGGFLDDQQHAEEEVAKKDKEDEEDATEIPTESRISKKLSEEITKVVVSLVLIMLFLTPVFQMDTYYSPYLLHQSALDMATDTYNSGFPSASTGIEGSWLSYKTAIETLIADTGPDSFYPTLFMQVPNPDGEPFNTDVAEKKPNEGSIETDLEKLRPSEFSAAVDVTVNGLDLIVAYSTKAMAQLEAAINIIRTLFVTFVLFIASVFFNNITNKWVLLPIERMLEKVKLMAENPLAAASEGDEATGIYDMMKQT